MNFLIFNLVFFSISLLGHFPARAEFSPKTLRPALNKGEVVLTIDDGPTRLATNGILGAIRIYQVNGYDIPATFFVNGSRLNTKSKKILDKIIEFGHKVANHSFNHKNLKQSPYKEDRRLIALELFMADNALLRFVEGYEDQAKFFRAPGGAWLNSYASVLNNEYPELTEGLQDYQGPVGWDIGGAMVYDKEDNKLLYTADWACWTKIHNVSPEDCAEGYLRLIKKKKKGTILMHDLKLKSVEMLKYLLVALTQKNLYKNEKYSKFIDYFEYEYNFIALEKRELR